MANRFGIQSIAGSRRGAGVVQEMAGNDRLFMTQSNVNGVIRTY
jgi:hypothetical protein